MPNHCQNKLTVLGTAPEVARFVAAADGPTQIYAPSAWELQDEKNGDGEVDRSRGRSVISFHALVPIPPEVEAGQYDPGGYAAEHRLWGVKWGAYDESRTLVREGRADYSFTTAWAPPYQFLATVSRSFKGLRFLISYSEEYPTRGRAIVEDGEVHELADDNGDTCPEYDEEDEGRAYYAWRHEYVNTHDAWADEEEGRTMPDELPGEKVTPRLGVGKKAVKRVAKKVAKKAVSGKAARR